VQVTQLKNLRVLHVKANCLQTLPDGFQQLKYLNVADNKLPDLSLLSTTALVSLDASGNQLECLPRGTLITDFKQLLLSPDNP
jgi:Leucine-rich repeat (LRR) protein